ncbi:MAG: hypothetical protein IJ700_08175, partial [Bacteroidaceae bacterium]|nr:hypothetical protein [Bacteroidaceae bacterium]
MLAGERSKVDPTGFGNDMSDIQSRDDVLTVLIHLGYLSYDWRKDECYIPNREVAGEMVNAVRKNQWKPVVDAIEQIRRKQYPAKVADYADRLLLVGISYDRQTKQHSCRIERP